MLLAAWAVKGGRKEQKPARLGQGSAAKRYVLRVCEFPVTLTKARLLLLRPLRLNSRVTSRELCSISDSREYPASPVAGCLQQVLTGREGAYLRLLKLGPLRALTKRTTANTRVDENPRLRSDVP